MKKIVQGVWVIICLYFPPAFADLSVTATHQVSAVRASNNTIEYGFTVEVTNTGGESVDNVIVDVSSDCSDIVMLNGRVVIGTVGANAAVTSNDFFSFQIDQSLVEEPNLPLDLAPYDFQFSVSPPPLALLAFTANPSRISEPGQRVALTWDSRGAVSATLHDDATGVEQTDLGGSGSLTVHPDITSRYTLTLQGAADELATTLTVTLEQAAPTKLWPEKVTFSESEQVATSVTVADDGSTYVGSFDKNFYKISANGEVSWAVENVGVVTGKAALVSDRVIFASNGNDAVAGRVIAISPDKVEYWHFDTDSAVIGSPVIGNAGDTVYVVTFNGRVHALDFISGQEKWQHQLPSGQTVAAAPTLTGPLGEQVLIARTVENAVFAIDTRESLEPGENRVLWTRELGE